MTKTTPEHVSKAEFEKLFQAVCNWGRWGPDDDKGTLNYIRPEHIRQGGRPGPFGPVGFDGGPHQQGGGARQSPPRNPLHGPEL